MRKIATSRRRGTNKLPTDGLLTVPLSALSTNGLVVQGCSAQVMRASQWRPVLRYVVTYLDRTRQITSKKVLIGKGYFRGDGARTYSFMKRLWSAGFAQDPLLAIPEPVGYVPELNLLLQGRAPGKALYLYLDNPAEAMKMVRLAARWLAKLHTTNQGIAPPLDASREKEKLGTWRDVLTQLFPELAQRFSRLADGAAAALSDPAEDTLVPTHGDFQHKNIYVLRRRVTVIDFDRSALAHPARDLGHFIGQSMTMSYVRTGSFREIQAWNHAYLDEYVGLTSETALAALPAHIVRAFLEVLYYKLFVRPVKDPSFLPAWLDEAERWLDEPF